MIKVISKRVFVKGDDVVVAMAYASGRINFSTPKDTLVFNSPAEAREQVEMLLKVGFVDK